MAEPAHAAGGHQAYAAFERIGRAAQAQHWLSESSALSCQGLGNLLDLTGKTSRFGGEEWQVSQQ
jgi:hypothetical protein